ncbi:hypothetical protein IJJ36_01820 [Candidatus Saccharibacteria bacterium]|nr:hypothetical protein [Candidatus Saccharibacteria bacterium]
MKDSNFNLPTPQMLIKKAKEETIPVSLRVKESTVAIFDKMAKEAGVNRGAMMNTWLDFYAQNYTSSSEDNSKDIMISYLNSERFWKVIPSLTPEELIYRLASNKNVEFGEAGDVHTLLKSYNNKIYDDVMLCIEPLDDGFSDSIYAREEVGLRCDEDSNDLFVTIEQWPLVSVLLAEYSQKYGKLFPNQSTCITAGMYEKIAKACKQYPKPDSVLATAIKGILLDFVEKQND